MEQIVKKEWGEEHWIVNREYCGKKLLLKRGFRCSIHQHPKKDETFHLESGLVWLEISEEGRLLRPGDSVHLPPRTPHRFSGIEDSVFYEFSTHHSDEDCLRDEPSGRIPDDTFRALREQAGLGG